MHTREVTPTRRVQAPGRFIIFNYAKGEYAPTQKVIVYPESTACPAGTSSRKVQLPEEFFQSRQRVLRAYPESKSLPGK